MQKIIYTSALICILINSVFAQARVFEGELIVGTASAKLIGKNISNIALSNQNDEMIELSSFHGKYLYIDFWFTGCKPCIEEIPSANKLKERLKTQDIVFINISFDIAKERWKDSIKKYQIDGENFWIGSIENINHWRDEYDMSTFPRYWIVSPEGVILHPDAERPSKYLQVTGLLEQDIETVSNIR